MLATISSTNSAYGAVYYNSSSPRFLNYTSTQAAVQLYKSSSIEAENALTFIKYFMAIDDATLVSTWSEVKAEFNKYSSIAAYFEGDARSDGILVERMLAKYDNVVSMYNLEDFLQRDVEIYQYSITINDGISGERVEKQPYNTDFTLPAAPVKHGFDFLGWSVNDKDPVKSGSVKFLGTYFLLKPLKSGSVKVLGDMSVVAVWSQKTALHVTYNTNGGSQVVDQTVYYAGESVELLNAPIKDHYSFVGWNVNGVTKQPGETFVITEDTEVTALWCANLGDVSVETEANFRYSLNSDGTFRKVTNTSLRIYLSLDKFSYEYLRDQGYKFTVGLTNYSKDPNSKATLTNIPVVYDEITETYRFDIAINVPVENVDTQLGIQLIATKEGSDPVLTTEVKTTFTDAADELYYAWLDDEVELTANQVAALETLIS